ncbi:hypothetical protein R1flu_021164 [Riccia fluitans]|uniref:cyclin-dependent kinase n=1 Tax=Riccia fluitans TaxID=41844 RepID=A0ABD1ZQ74_9MARC
MEPTESSWPPFKDTWSLHGNREIVSRYQILEKIGEGAFADVYRAVRREDGQIVALKEVHDSDSSYREVNALLLLDHPNVVKLYEYFVQGSNMVLVLEYLPFNLSQVIKAGNISEADAKGWSIQILQGLAACHAASILHRDIKPANLLIAEDGTLKVADFGTARVLGKDDDGEVVQDDYGSEVADGVDPFLPSVEADFIRVASSSLNALNAERPFDEQQAASSRISPGGSGINNDEEEEDETRTHVLGSRGFDVGLEDNASIVEDDGRRRYLEVEKMVRNGSQLMGRSVRTASHLGGAQGEDPGCCGWFSSSEREDVVKLNKPKEDGYRTDSRYINKYASSSESDGSWEEKRGLQNLVSKPNPFAGDEFERVLKKRTRRLSSEQKRSVPFSESAEASAGEEEEEEVWKEPSRNWPQASQLLEHSSLTNIFTRSSAAEVQTSSSVETSSSESHKENPFHRNGVVGSNNNFHEGSDVLVDDFRVNTSEHDEIEMQRRKSHKHMPSGPLREMADACLTDELFAADDGHNRAASPALETGDAKVLEKSHRVGLDGLDKASKDETLSCSDKASKDETVSCSAESAETVTFRVFSEGGTYKHTTISRSEPINIKEEGGGSSRNQSGQEFGYESTGSGKMGGASWIDMGENVGSPADIQGTRWFGAPEFRDSYMEVRNQNVDSGETGRIDSEFEEWEDVAEGGTSRDGDRSSDRGENKSEDASVFTTMVGTRWYRAPEMLYGATKYGMEVDIWAFGCIFGELLSGKPLFPGINDIDQLSRLVRILGSPTKEEWEDVTLLPDFGKIRFVDGRSPLTLRNHLPDISGNSLQFLEKVLVYDPKRRLTAAQGLQDDYFCKEPVPTPPSSLKLPAADGEPWDLDDDNMTASEWGSYGLHNVGLYDYPSDSDCDPSSDYI